MLDTAYQATKNAGLYPEILFHFTEKQESLHGILERNFQVSYAREKIVGNSKVREFGAPMVSFCDLRLSELSFHMENYGGYGIGLDKKWAYKNGLNPVLYMSASCSLADDLIDAVDHSYKQCWPPKDGDVPDVSIDRYMKLLNIYRYMKNYQGDLVRRDKKTIENYRFADEREWRYVPPIPNTLLSFVPIEQISTAEDKNRLNENVSHLKLIFEPDDIRYLIVEHETDRLVLIEHLDHAKHRFDEPTRRRLASRILSAEQIRHDI